MRAALRSRLEKLEVRAEQKKPQLFRSGYLKTLPTDYVGERHVVMRPERSNGANSKNGQTPRPLQIATTGSRCNRSRPCPT